MMKIAEGVCGVLLYSSVALSTLKIRTRNSALFKALYNYHICSNNSSNVGVSGENAETCPMSYCSWASAETAPSTLYDDSKAALVSTVVSTYENSC